MSRIAILSGKPCALHDQGCLDYGHTVILSEISNAILANNSGRCLPTDERKRRIFFPSGIL